MLKLPEMLDIPEKLYPLIFEFNDYDYFLIEGGRGGGKSHSVARFLLYVASKRKVRICCGREVQNTINDSVKTLFDDILKTYPLNFESSRDRIINPETGSTIIFKGLRENENINIKGLEGIDILWIDEAQAITKPTLEIIIPTIRKQNSKIIYTMNRLVRKDPVYVNHINDKDCKHIKINYYDNKYCPDKIIKEAEKLKQSNYEDYKRIYEGIPLDKAQNILIAASKLDNAAKLIINPDKTPKIKVLSFDLAGSGSDLNVAKILECKNSNTWENTLTFSWSEPDTDVTTGKIINLIQTHNPVLTVGDADGVGYAIVNRIKNTVKSNVIPFRGAAKVKNQKTSAANARAEGYLNLKEFIENGFLKVSDEKTLNQLEYMKVVYKPNGLTYILSKDELRKEHGESPDFADTLMMSIYAINNYAYLLYNNNDYDDYGTVTDDFDPFQTVA